MKIGISILALLVLIIVVRVLSGGLSMEQMKKDQVLTLVEQAGHSPEMLDSLSRMQIVYGDRRFIWVSEDRLTAQLMCIDSCLVETLYDKSGSRR